MTEAEKEQILQLVLSCARGISIEINGETHALGCMMSNPAAAQYATAFAIHDALDAFLQIEKPL